MAASLLNDDIKVQVQNIFSEIKEPVQVLFFGKKTDCETCADTLQLLQEVIGLSDKLSLNIYDEQDHIELARQYHVDKFPGFVIAGKDGDQVIDFGVRFAGIPSGHEFSSLIHDLVLVSGRDSGLSAQTRENLKKITSPVHLQVFVTPTCPYCPQAVVLAHQMAMESPLVEAEMVEAVEFPDLSDEIGVSGVPHTTINMGAGTLIGAAPEQQLLAEILRAAGKN